MNYLKKAMNAAAASQTNDAITYALIEIARQLKAMSALTYQKEHPETVNTTIKLAVVTALED